MWGAAENGQGAKDLMLVLGLNETVDHVTGRSKWIGWHSSHDS